MGPHLPVFWEAPQWGPQGDLWGHRVMVSHCWCCLGIARYLCAVRTWGESVPMRVTSVNWVAAGASCLLDEGGPRNRTFVFLDKGNLVHVKESEQAVNTETHAMFQWQTPMIPAACLEIHINCHVIPDFFQELLFSYRTHRCSKCMYHFFCKIT